MKTSASMFSGGALFDIGAQMAGYKILWGIEWDDKIAAVARLNGFPVITGDVTKFDFTILARPDHLHASPPCPNFSVAKTNGEETEFDVAMAESVCKAIEYFKPDTFTLENVPAYVHSQSFKRIINTLHSMAYFVDWQNLNSANFGVPQTRNRLWVRASRNLMMLYPEPVKWVGWYEAIEDLIPTLPDAEFAPWQLARLPKEYKDFMIGKGTYSSSIEREQPAQTITANNNQSAVKAFIMSSGNNSFQDAKEGAGVRYAAEPVMTMMAGKTEAKIKAFVIDSGNSRVDKKLTLREHDDAMFTVMSSMDKTPVRGFVGAGRIVKMTVKALGRFQTVPDWYKGLTVRINGNGVPCKLAKAVLETF